MNGDLIRTAVEAKTSVQAGHATDSKYLFYSLHGIRWLHDALTFALSNRILELPSNLFQNQLHACESHIQETICLDEFKS